VVCAPEIPPANVFKAYDIRGLYDKELASEGAQVIGRAFARVLAERSGKSTHQLRVGLGRDMRLSSPEMAGAVKAGLTREGVTVLDCGMVGTEMLYFLVGSQQLDGGAMVTASHNPKPYTGVKLVREGAVALAGDSGIQEIRRLLEAGLPDPPGEGSVTDVDIVDSFQEKVLSFINKAQVQPRRVVVDGGNGMAGPMVGPVLKQLDMELIETYWEPDGNFPDHEPNPLLEENRRFIIEKVKSEKADLGIAWDGDGDRCFFIDDTGAFVDGDFLTALLAESILKKYPGATILYDVRASRAVPDVVRAAGGKALVNRVGHAFFKKRMKEENAVFGGEVSGHYYFRDFFCADSGTIPALLILELLSLQKQSLSELVNKFRQKYFISGEINSEVADQKAKLVEIKNSYSDGSRIEELDGLSIDYDDWHFNVRPSNTEPLLRLNLESLQSRQHMEEKRDEILQLIRS
jgi:phosphomannomutase